MLNGAGDPAEATALLLRDNDCPTPDGPGLLDLVPEQWVIEVGGHRGLDKARLPRLPKSVRVDSFGSVTDDGILAAFFETLHFCPSVVQDQLRESTRQSEFSWVASLGTEGRASAVSVQSQAVIRTLRDADLDDEARKFLAFSDNRQDASVPCWRSFYGRIWPGWCRRLWSR